MMRWSESPRQVSLLHALRAVCSILALLVFLPDTSGRHFAAAEDTPATAKTAPPSRREIGPHGGTMVRVDDLMCEVVFGKSAIELYLFDNKGQPQSTDKARGRVSLSRRGQIRNFRFDLYPHSGSPDIGNGLSVVLDPSQIADRKAAAEVVLHGIGNRRIRFIASTASKLTPRQMAARRPVQSNGSKLR